RRLALAPAEPERCGLSPSALGALLYARPESLWHVVIEALAPLFRPVPLPKEIGWAPLRIFGFLASPAHAAPAWAQLKEILADQSLDLQRRQRLLPATREFVDWSPDVVEIDDILALARSFPLADRPFLFDH